MFSGIVEGLEKAKIFKKNAQSLELTLPAPKGWEIKQGESINIDGICSTVKSVSKIDFSVYYMPETIRVTNLKYLKPDHNFNLERSLSLNNLIGGHLVSGHIDTTAKVESIELKEQSKVLKFKIEEKFIRYIIYKGSIAVNGVSLTIVSEAKNYFTVSLIPYTLTHTNLRNLKVGDLVNIEVDLMAKYLEKLLKPWSVKIK
ncbi:riboflavin synthase [Candidatus Daviesbacteria bacterium]|nr:riboflavin synthase [Candidatus Daviesbacteria bacterium]